MGLSGIRLDSGPSIDRGCGNNKTPEKSGVLRVKRRERDSNPCYGYKPVERFSKPSPNSTSSDGNIACGGGENRLSPGLLLNLEKHPELVELIEAWSTLPAALKAGIQAMVKSAT